MIASQMSTMLKEGERKEEEVYKSRIAPENVGRSLPTITKSQLKHIEVGPAKKFKRNPNK